MLIWMQLINLTNYCPIISLLVEVMMARSFFYFLRVRVVNAYILCKQFNTSISLKVFTGQCGKGFGRAYLSNSAITKFTTNSLLVQMRK